MNPNTADAIRFFIPTITQGIALCLLLIALCLLFTRWKESRRWNKMAKRAEEIKRRGLNPDFENLD